jgi:cytochrome P450
VSPTSGAPLNILDPYLYAGDPYPAYRWLRDTAPVYWDPVNRIWGISRYDDVLSVERDTARYSSASGSRPLIEMSASMINRDDPGHLLQRKLVSVWVHGAVAGEPLDLPEIIQEGLLLLDGGAETTRSVIGQTVWNLARFPDQREILLADPSVIGSAGVEEFIRFATPILNMRRTVTVDHELHGQRLREGDQVLLMYGAANSDGRAFSEPDRFDVTRRPGHHVAFGFGTHFCLGANLARLELRILFEELLRALPGIRLVPGREPEFMPGYFTRTLRELWVEFSPAG